MKIANIKKNQTSCARYGVHPSQWCLGMDELINQQEELNLRDVFVNNEPNSLFKEEQEVPDIKL